MSLLLTNRGDLMAKVFKTVVELQKHMESACRKAVENACNRLLGRLQEIIDEE